MLPHSWHVPASTEYYATVTSPKRYHGRVAEAGIDFAVLYPSMGIALFQLPDEGQRVTICRLYNEFVAENLDVGQVSELLIENDPTLARYSAGELIHTRGRMTRVGTISKLLPTSATSRSCSWRSASIPGGRSNAS